MADGVCEEGTGPCFADKKLDSTRADFATESEDALLDVKPTMVNRDGAFFTHKDAKKCRSMFGSALHGAQEEVCIKEENLSKKLTMHLKTLCEESEDNCRKKRCTDRYDSSESLDSGVVVNSDYSSSSSSGHSDITDPGSPSFSESSEDSSPSPARATPPVSAPLKQDPSEGGSGSGAPGGAPAGGGNWAWSGESELVHPASPPPQPVPSAPTTASKCNAKRHLDNNNSSSSTNNNINSNKKLKVEQLASATLCVQSAVPCVNDKKECLVKSEDGVCSGVVVQQVFEPDLRGKITHYYKPKKKSDDKRIPLVKAVTMGFTPFMPAIIASKGSVSNIPVTPPDKVGQVLKSEPLGREMIDFKMASTFKCPVDLNVKKVSSGLTIPPNAFSVLPTQVPPIHTDLDEKKVPAIFKNGTIPEKIKLEVTAASVQASALCSRLDEKWIACPELPAKPKAVSIPATASTRLVTPLPCESPSTVSVSTPTKPVSNTTPIDRTVSSQSCMGIREQCDVKETRTGFTSDNLVEKVSESVVPEAVISTNGLTEPVSGQLTVNTTITPSFLAPAPVGPKSPILSVPKSIRFPARSLSKPQSDAQGEETFVNCLWKDCSLRFDCDSTLLEHLQEEHVNSQKTDSFVCYWTGCKVFGRASCSISWLERHVLSHGGNKPFRCIVDGCGMRFSSQLMLERHVNWHFKQTETPPSNSSAARRSLDTPPNKLLKRCGKKLRYRRQPWSARQFDYFDAGVMESLQYQLVLQAETMPLDLLPGGNVTLHSKVIAQRVKPDGSVSVLLRWFPRNFLDDEWVLKKEMKATRSIRLTEYPEDSPESLSSAGSSLYSTPPSSPSVISSPSTSNLESEDEGPSTQPSHLWVLEAAAAVAADVVGSKPLQSRKSRRKPLKKAAVT